MRLKFVRSQEVQYFCDQDHKGTVLINEYCRDANGIWEKRTSIMDWEECNAPLSRELEAQFQAMATDLVYESMWDTPAPTDDECDGLIPVSGDSWWEDVRFTGLVLGVAVLVLLAISATMQISVIYAE